VLSTAEQDAGAVALAVFRHKLTSVADTMGATLRRAAFSANIKERLDYSCAVFDSRARLLAQAAHIPVHLGAMEAAVKAATEGRTWELGDIVVLNDPYRGGSHLPDLTTVSAVFVGGAIRGYVATRAHHADIGGPEPGSMATARDLFGEGLVIPPVRLAGRDGLSGDVAALILANSRTPDERTGDLMAQIAAHRRGEDHLGLVIRSFDEGPGSSGGGASDAPPVTAAAAQPIGGSAGSTARDETPFDRLCRQSIGSAARVSEALAATIGRGPFEFEDVLEGDGVDQAPIRIHVAISQADGTVTFDFTGSSGQCRGNLNAPLAVTRSAVSYVWSCLLEGGPQNAGSFECLHVVAPTGSVLNPVRPAGVAGGNVETSQRVADVVMGALAQALPHRVPAASQGTMNNLMFGGRNRAGAPFTYYETLGGGAGAGPQRDGAHAIQVHMTNTANTPVEALEATFPVRVLGYARRYGSGGSGAHRGGDGLQRRIQFLVPARVTLLTDRRDRAPFGLAGGSPGAPGANILEPSPQDSSRSWIELPAKGSYDVAAGDVLMIQTPGGGGWGAAFQEDDSRSP
jgi:N-methylhydantoinase B